MEVQIHSDLHIEELDEIYKIKPKFDTLILAGDITNIEDSKCFKFFNYINKNWKKTFVVLGNHEYYSQKKISYYNLNSLYHDFFDIFDNIELLDQKVVYYKNYKIIGCTLWSPGNELNLDVNVLKKIHNRNNEPISYKFYNKLFEQQKKWLLENIEDETIVITHYPIFDEGGSHPKYNNDDPKNKDYICSNFLKDIDKKNCVFISGHTHYNYDYWDNGHRLIANQKGYNDEDVGDYNVLGLWDL